MKAIWKGVTIAESADTVVVEYRTASGGAPQTLERKLSQGGWLTPR